MIRPRQIYSLTLRKVHGFMLARGFRADQLFAGTGISERDLEDPYRLVHATQARRYYENVVSLDPSEGLGLEIGWTTNLSDLGSHGLVQITSRTAEEALKRGHSNRYLYNLLLEWETEVVGADVVNVFSSDEPAGPLRLFLLERGLGTIQAGAEELVGPDAKPTKVLVDYAAPRHFHKYEEVFRCPVHFGAARCAVYYPLEYLGTALSTHDPYVHELMDSLQSSLVKRLETGKDVVHDVVMALRRKPGTYPSLERVAESLAMSSRTLRRKLGQSNVTFQQLLDDERHRVAESYLSNSDLSIQHIAELCGFQDAQNFSQAFKRWTGLSPSEYRRSKRGS